MFANVIRWVAAALAGAAVVGLQALAAKIGIAPADVPAAASAAVAAGVIAFVNWLIGKLPIVAE